MLLCIEILVLVLMINLSTEEIDELGVREVLDHQQNSSLTRFKPEQ